MTVLWILGALAVLLFIFAVVKRLVRLAVILGAVLFIGFIAWVMIEESVDPATAEKIEDAAGKVGKAAGTAADKAVDAAAPVAKKVGEKAAPLAKKAAEKTAEAVLPVAQKAAEKTAEVASKAAGKVAEKVAEEARKGVQEAIFGDGDDDDSADE